MESEYIKIYTGSIVLVQLVSSKLQEIGISPVIKEQNESGLDPKIYGGHLLQEIYVNKDQVDEAVPIVQGIISEMESQN
jgi:hypothetical protein